MFQEGKRLLKTLSIPLLVGVVAGFFTKDGMQIFESMTKPPLSPSAVVFPIVWTILYLFMGISSYIVAGKDGREGEKALTLYGYQLIVNFLWPVFFFSFEWYFFSLLWLLFLWFLVLKMIFAFYQVFPAAAYLNIPYLIWLTFAAYLNAGVWILNR